MGAGVGALVRIAVFLKNSKSFIEFIDYSPYWLKKLPSVTRFKCPIKYFVYYL